MIILNDNPTQKLHCNFQGIRVINLDTRIPSLGQKYNVLASLAEGTIILPWEDDDVSLPHRISDSVDRIGDTAWFHPRGSWFHDRRGLHWTHSHGYLVNASAIRKEFIEAVPFANVSGNQDADWYVRATLLTVPSHRYYQHPREWSYVYRWGMRQHLSGFTDTERAYRDADKGLPGTYEIVPRWHHDYRALISAALLSIP